jgi:propanediol utilization protein
MSFSTPIACHPQTGEVSYSVVYATSINPVYDQAFKENYILLTASGRHSFVDKIALAKNFASGYDSASKKNENILKPLASDAENRGNGA